MIRTCFLCLMGCLLLVDILSAQTISDIQNALWYRQPADTWTQALPIGNGRLGAMIYGDVNRERIQFNEETLWTGKPVDYAHPGAYLYLDSIRQLLFAGKQAEAESMAMDHFMSVPLRQEAYQPFGDLLIHFPDHNNYSNYRRELDLEKAVHRVVYRANGVNYSREIIASHPQDIIAIKLSADQSEALNFGLQLTSPHEQSTTITKANQQQLNVQVKGGALRGTARLKVITDGSVQPTDSTLQISKATTATIYLTTATNYRNYRDISGDPEAISQSVMDNTAGKNYENIRQAHVEDYRSLFDRFALSLEKTNHSILPTDQRIIRFWEKDEDAQLMSLYVQYGRYLLISSSRPGTRPANLQGIWNDQLQPPWDSKYTVNINTEMNYWPAEITNLQECHEPLFQMLEEVAQTGKNVARQHYDSDGWVLHHNTDIWRGSAPINHANHGIWVSGGAWLSLHLWEHYLFTQDMQFLRAEAYPLMKGAAEFFVDFLIEDPETGWLISTPSNSPETGGLVAGPSMDHQIIRALFRAVMQAGKILEKDPEFAKELLTVLPKIAPNQIGRHGQLQEWVDDIDDPENKHRHVSHLWAMHPGSEINWEDTPELMEAARQSLLFRGDDGTGWSLAWKINFWARFREPDRAYQLVRMLFRPVQTDKTDYMGGGGSYPNLFDAHPPFQIDGNFGGAAGIVEMLIQSHLGSIDLLPALPEAMQNGSIRGVRARGGFELDFEWKNKKLKEVKVQSLAGKECKIRYDGQTISFPTEAGAVYEFDGKLRRNNE